MKERIMCKTHCIMWNDIDKDCEIYGENHPCPRGCPYYQTHTAFEHTKEIDRLRDTLVERERQIVDLSKTIERLQEQLNEANEIIISVAVMPRFPVNPELCREYLKKWGVK